MTRKMMRFTLRHKLLFITFLIIVSFLAIFIPTFLSLATNAQIAATNAIAGALSAANAANVASRTMNATAGIAVFNCTDVSNLYQGSLPIGYTITAAAITVGNTIACQLSGPHASTATFSATGIS